jgi:hypothetical protein
MFNPVIGAGNPIAPPMRIQNRAADADPDRRGWR